MAGMAWLRPLSRPRPCAGVVGRIVAWIDDDHLGVVRREDSTGAAAAMGAHIDTVSGLALSRG